MHINIVLYEPEIPMNVGNIMRTCSAFHCQLHLIRPYGFFLNDRRLVRSATNHLLPIREYDDWADFLGKNLITKTNLFLYTKRGATPPDAIDYKRSVGEDGELFLLFGRESTGVPQAIMETLPNQWVRIPMDADMVSLNLSNTVAIAVYEVLRQEGYPDLIQDAHWKWDA